MANPFLSELSEDWYGEANIIWYSPVGKQLVRTVRFSVSKLATVGDVRNQARDAAIEMFAGRGMYGSDTISLGPASIEDATIELRGIF
jgi:hypothetical protein